MLYPDIIINGHSNYPSENRSEKQQQTEFPVIPSDYNSNEILLKAATIAVPICGAIILFVLMAFAIRMLKSDGIDSPSKLSIDGTSSTGGGGNGSRKSTLDYEAAYGAAAAAHHTQNLKQFPLLLNKQQHQSNELFNNQNMCHNDLKNECLAKKNQLMTLEYTLLPQSCSDNKQTNTDAGAGTTTSHYRNINLSLNETGRSKDVYDNKIYEKEILNPAPYWAGNNNANNNN